MRWAHQLRWKLFLSHLVIVVVADVVLLVTALFFASVGLVNDAPLTLGTAAAETGSLEPSMFAKNPLMEQFQIVLEQALFVSGFAALGAAIIVSLFVSRRIVEPIQSISSVSRRLSQGFYRERTLISSDDELADLSRSVNQLAETLDQSEQRRLALLADVTHELRTPLATISGYMEGLIDGVIQPNAPTFALVLRESNRLQRLIEDLELLSRAEAGQLTIFSRPVDICAILERLVTQFQPQFAADQIELGFEPPPAMPLAWADPDRIDQVLINLLANAFRYSSAGGNITLRVHAELERMVVAVEDSGAGIAPEHLPHLFERFYRVDKSRARTSGGSGIGLTISRLLVYAQGGEIWAASPGLGAGATFFFSLPLAPRHLTDAIESVE